MPRLSHFAALAGLVALAAAATAQPLPPGSIPNSPPPGVRSIPPSPGTGGPICTRLEDALLQLDQGGSGNPDTTRRYEDAIARQRVELEQTLMQSRRMGCDSGGGFFLFGSLNRPPQCDQMNIQIDRMRSNLDRMMREVAGLRGDDGGRELQRRQLIASLAQNNCGPQYRVAAAPQPSRPRGLFESIFGGPMREESMIDADPLQMPGGSGYRTVCVRTCDGFFFPISAATTPANFSEDEKSCQRLCPAAEVALYTYRSQDEGIEQAVAVNGSQPYSALPTAFRYRQQYDAACSCRSPGQSWAEALIGGRDATLQPGDIVVTEERAKQMSLPKMTPEQRRAQGAKTLPTTASKGQPEQVQQQQQPPQPPAEAVTPSGERKVRTVGPEFYPVR